jgi:histone-lysine N-methyltransferase SETD2
LSKSDAPKSTPTTTPQRSEDPAKKEKKEKWRSLPVEKQMKLYENTVSPSIFHVRAISNAG